MLPLFDALPTRGTSKPCIGDDAPSIAARAAAYRALGALWTAQSVVIEPLRIADSLWRADGVFQDGSRFTVWVLYEA